MAKCDIRGAYLNATITGEEVLMKLDHGVISLVKIVLLGLKSFVDNSGQLIVKLDKVLYRCVQSACLY